MNATEIWTSAFLNAQQASAPDSASEAGPRRTCQQKSAKQRLMVSVFAALTMTTGVAACAGGPAALTQAPTVTSHLAPGSDCVPCHRAVFR